jgi:tetratricopeptide (TPR) repeat protein
VVTAKGGAAQSVTTNTSGRYKLNLEYGKRHTIEITKPGFAKRYFVVDLTNVREQDLSSGEDFASLDLVMVAEVPGADLSALSNTPITTFTFNKNAGQLVKDAKQEAASNKALDDAKAKIAAADQNKDAIAQENQKKLQEKIKAGDQFFTAGDFEKAVKAFEDAVDFAGKNKLDDAEALNKLDKADAEFRKKRDAELADKQANETLFKIIDDGKKLELQKDLKGAKAKYEEALALKPGFKDAVDLLANVEKAIAEQEAEEKKNADYQKAMAEAKALFDAEQWKESKAKYEEAKAIKPLEKEPPAQILILEKKIADQEKNAANLAKFDGIMAAALELQNAEKYDEAISKYKEAQLLIKERTEPKEGIDFCEQKKKEKADLAKAQADKEKLDKDYAVAIQKADAFFDGKKYAEAIKEYEIATKLKPEESHPQTRITESQNALAENASAEEKKKQFELLKKDGEKALLANNLPEAKEKYNAANALIPNDAGVLAKIAEIEKKEKDLADAQAAENAYKDAMSQGENAVNNGAYLEAKTFFEQAKKLKPAEKLPQERITFVENKMKEMEADLAKKKQFDDLVAAATTKEANNDLSGALVDLKKAYDLIKDAGIQNRIATLEKNIADQANLAKKKADYDAAIQKADLAFNNKEWDNAIKLYQEAKKVDASQNYPDQQIGLAQTELSKMQNAKQRKDSFDKMFADAEKLFAEKKYAEADLAYENALNYADEQADKDKTIKRRADIKDALDKIEGINRQKKAYDDAMLAAQNFEKANDLDGALTKYKEASDIDNTQALPKQKITELSQKIAERDKNNTQQIKFNEIIDKGNELFLQGKFIEAINKYKESEAIIPNSPITKQKIDEVNAKIKENEKIEQDLAYQKILTDGQNARDLKNYDLALKLYNQAALQRPEDPLPKTKINEINEEIERNKREEADEQTRKARYAKTLEEGYNFLKEDQLEKALASFNEAARLMPNEPEPKQKIEQITNLIATRDADADAQRNKLAEITRLTEAGDKAFNTAKYDEALQHYKDAIALKPGDEILGKKITLTEERIADMAKSEEERAWRTKLAAADKAFTERDYDLALGLYNEVLNLNPGNKRATEQIALIERIKTPSSESTELEDFGNPSYNSILEGEALMAQAERQREYNRLTALRNTMVDIEDNMDAQFNQEGLDVRGTYNTTRDMEREGEAFNQEKKEEQMRTENAVRTMVEDMTDAQLLENLLAYKDIIDVQFAIRNINEEYIDGVQGNYRIPNMNDEEIKQYLLNITQNTDGNSLGHLDLLLTNEAFIQGLYNLSLNDPDFSRLLVDLNVAFLTTLMLDLDNVSNDQLQSQQAYLDKVLESLNNYAEFINDETQQNYESAFDIHGQVVQIYESTNTRSEQDRQAHDEQRQELLELIKSVEALIVDQNNDAIDRKTEYQNTVADLQANHIDMQLAMLRLNYLKMHLNDQELKALMLYGTEEYDLWVNDIKNAYAELKELERKVQQANDQITEDKQTLAYRNTQDINQMIADKETAYSEDHDKQNQITSDVVQIERSTGDAYQEKLDEAKRKINENRVFLDQLERRELVFNDAAANALGQQFPEGVTEENFVNKDEDGLVVEVKTRRIVVINGVGNVYVRFSNKYGVTYTKNGVSITEYQWIKETQNAKLPKYKVN